MTDRHTPVGQVHHYGPGSDFAMYKKIINNPEDTHVLWNPNEPIYAHPENTAYEKIQMVTDLWRQYEIDENHPLNKNFYHVSLCHERTSGFDFNGPQFGQKIPWTDYYAFNFVNEFLGNINKGFYNWDWYSRPEFLYSYTSGRPKIHRVKLLCTLIDLNLIPKGVVNFCNSSKLWDVFLHTWKKTNDDTFDKILSVLPEIMHPSIVQRTRGYHRNDALIPGYDLTFCEIVSETDVNLCMLSEKTIRPILLGKPFVVAGGAQQNSFLKSLGYEEYNEIFNYGITFKDDYDFASYSKIIESLCNIDCKQETLLNLKHKLRPKTVHNQSVLIKRLFDDSLIPDSWMIPPGTKASDHTWIEHVRSLVKNDGYFSQFV